MLDNDNTLVKGYMNHVKAGKDVKLFHLSCINFTL